MLGTSHSWAVTMRNLLKNFHNLDNNLYLKSINGMQLFPSEWKPFLRDIADPDIDIAYTLPRNFEHRFKKASKLKLAIYNYETSTLPEMWKDAIKHIDYALPSSTFSKKVFVDSGWPEEKCIVVPHGINLSDFKTKEKIKLTNDKKFRFLNVSIPHYRKNINLLVDAYYSAFTNKDDVCLVIKTSLKKPKNYFECDIRKQLMEAQAKHRKRNDLPIIELVDKRYESIVPLYNSCDVLVSATSSEGFGLPLLEGLAAGMLVIAPRFSGQLDFLSDKNYMIIRLSRQIKNTNIGGLRLGLQRAFQTL
jgi:glycosyltransferase involved in cell wall biosynthesis